jgi:hypothetical protein
MRLTSRRACDNPVDAAVQVAARAKVAIPKRRTAVAKRASERRTARSRTAPASHAALRLPLSPFPWRRTAS